MKIENCIKCIFLFIFSTWTIPSYAQFYNTGVDPASTKWKQIKSNQRKVIFPDYYEQKAKVINNLLDTLTPYISYNLSGQIEKYNVILHPTNRYSNGFVSWAPKRMELSTPPPTNLYSTPWLKQLIAHEYRHVAQMSNLNIGITRSLGYVIAGEIVLGAVIAIMPGWYLEGDATLIETQFSMNGRAEQPSFSIGLRALLNEKAKINDKSNILTKKTTYNKWTLGSFKEYTPSIYEFGYFMTAASYRYYGDDYWKTILRYTGRNPYLIVPDNIAARKFYQTSTQKLFKRTLEELREYWHDESQKPNSSTLLNSHIDSYTTYSSAQHFSDNLIIAQKQSFSEIKQIVLYDTHTSKERRLRFTPSTFTRSNKITIQDSSIYWSEYKPSIFWEQSVGSVIKKANLYEKNGKLRLSRPKTVYKHPNSILVTPVEGDKLAMICYDNQNNPSIELFDKDFNKLKTFNFEGIYNSFNGLAYDDKTSKLYYILIGDEGTVLGSIDPNNGDRDTICGPTYMKLSNLSAKNGRLFFGSTESSKDEVHMVDLKDNTQYQLTSSQYGSFAGIGGSDSKIALSTYTIDGYILAEQSFNTDTLRKVDSKQKQPNKNLVVPVKDWKLPKLDTMNISESISEIDGTKIKKYNKTSHLIGLPHSWVPAVVTSMDLLNDFDYRDIGVGVTGIFQNSLSSMTGLVGYGWLPAHNKSLFMADMSYNALPVNISLGVTYGGKNQDILAPSSAENLYTGKVKDHLNLDVEFSMPMNFSGGTNYRTLSPFVNFSFENSITLNELGGVSLKNNTKMRYGVSYSSFRATVLRDIAPTLGYSLMASGMHNPTRKDFGKFVNLYAKGYLPGILKHHSLGVAVAYQHQFTDKYNYIQEFMLPRGNNLLGVTDQTLSTAINYMLPIANADLIIPSLLDIRRIYFNIFGEYAKIDYLSQKLANNKDMHTIGGELFLNFNIFGFSTFDFTLGLSLYKASQYDKIKFGTSFKVDF